MSRMVDSLRRVAPLGVAVLALATAAWGQPPLPEMPDLGVPLKPDGFVRHWVTLGPLPFDGGLDGPGLLNEAALQPRPGDITLIGQTEHSWRRFACNANNPQVRFPGPNDAGHVAYAVAYIACDLDWAGLQLRCGAQNGLRLWLNGQQLLSSAEPRDLDGHVLPNVALKKGVNTLVLKVLGGGGFFATARFTDEAGNPIPDFFASQTPTPLEPDRPGPSGEATLTPDDDGYIRDWLVLAYFPAGGGLGTGILPDEANARPRPGEAFSYGQIEPRWTPHRSAVYLMDLVHYVGGPCDNALGYAVAYILCNDTIQDLRMLVGSDDQSLMWLNGEQVMVTQSGWLAPDKDSKAGVTLRRGLNVLMTKTVNVDHLWQVCVRFVDAAGNPVRAFAVRYEPDETGLRQPRNWPAAPGVGG